MSKGAARDGEGFAKLPNALVARGILAHLRPNAVKVYLAILLATRNRTNTCWPSVKTLSRWSGVSKVSRETDYLERHGLIKRKWLKLGGKPRRIYHILEACMLADVRQTCSACMLADVRQTCLKRDPATGRLLGKVPGAGIADHRHADPADHRHSHMLADVRQTNQTEADEKVLSRRGGGCKGEGQDGPARSASPLTAASLAVPALEAEPTGERKATSNGKNGQGARVKAIRTLLSTFSGDRTLTRGFALKAGYPEAEIEEVLAEVTVASSPSPTTEPSDGYPGSHPAENVATSACSGPPGDTPGHIPGETAIDYNRRCEVTIRAWLACVGSPVVGSRFCKRHQTQRETALICDFGACDRDQEGGPRCG